MPQTLGRRVETGSGRVGNTPRESKIPRKEGRKGTLRVGRRSATPETDEITPASVETDREGRKPPNRTDTRTFVLHEPKNTPLTLPEPEILPQNGHSNLSNARNTHLNTHRDEHPANANTHPANNHPVNDHRWNDHPVKTTRKLGRRPHARRIAGGEGGGSLAPVPPPQDSGGGGGTFVGRIRPKENRRRARRQDSRRGSAAAFRVSTTAVARATFWRFVAVTPLNHPDRGARPQDSGRTLRPCIGLHPARDSAGQAGLFAPRDRCVLVSTLRPAGRVPRSASALRA